MNTLANAITVETTKTFTENGDNTYNTSGDKVLDLFFRSGAMRRADEQEIINVFSAAYTEDAELTLRTLLYTRDREEGPGERRFTRVALNWLAKNHPHVAGKLLDKIVELGRWDDILAILGANPEIDIVVLDMYASALIAGNGLAAKWAPRKGPVAAKLRSYMERTPKQYRKLIVGLTKVVETQMCAKDWDNIDYSSVPSIAATRYANAFRRHSPQRYSDYLESVMTGKVNASTGKVEKINTSVSQPYDVIRMDDKVAAQAVWDNLPDHLNDVSFIPMIDVSGSMSCQASGSITCMDVAVSLGVYLAERNKTAFKDLALTFADNPSWIKIDSHDNILDIFRDVKRAQWDLSTNLDGAMNLVLQTAINNNVPAEDMPEFLIVMSDMEFNAHHSGESTTAAQRTKTNFESAGYKMPNIIWWNIQSRNGVVPVRGNEEGMVLVSGFSPALMQNVLSGEITPMKMMLQTIMKDRYSF